MPEAPSCPLPKYNCVTRQSCADEYRAERQTMFKLHPFQPSSQAEFAAREFFRVAEYLYERPYGNDVHSQKHQHHCQRHGVDVEFDLSRERWPRQQPEHEGNAQQHQQAAGQKKEPVWRREHDETQMPPAIPKRPQMGRPVSLIGPHGNGNFCDSRTRSGRLDQRFGSKLHSVGPEIEASGKLAGEAAHAAIDVADARAKKQIQNTRENRGAELSVVPGHGAFFDLAQKPVTNHEVVSGMPLLNKPRDFRKIVTAVSVTEND